MSDDEGDWENFSVPTFGSSAAVAPAAADEEEDLTLQELKAGPAVSAPSASQLAEKERKIRQEEEMLANKLKFALLENETPEQRKLREKKQQEESEMRLMKDDLFGLSEGASNEASSSSTGIAAIPLKTKQDHINFAITCANKLGPSTSIQASTYLMELTNRMKNNLTTETLDALLNTLKAVRDTRKTTEVATTKKSKKEIKAVAKKHADVFGGEDDGEDGGKFNASYSHLEDDFM